MQWIVVVVYIGFPALLGAFIYPTPKRMARWAKRAAKFEAKYGIGEDDD
jgi:hypothetical protein